jgi:hypothetical protein
MARQLDEHGVRPSPAIALDKVRTALGDIEPIVRSSEIIPAECFAAVLIATTRAWTDVYHPRVSYEGPTAGSSTDGQNLSGERSIREVSMIRILWAGTPPLVMKVVCLCLVPVEDLFFLSGGETLKNWKYG